MPLTLQDVQAEQAAWTPPDDKVVPHPMAGPAEAPPSPIEASMVPPPKTPTPSFLDSVISTVDNYSSKFGEAVVNSPAGRLLRQGEAGAIKGAVNTADAVKSGIEAIPDNPKDPNANASIGPDLFHPAYDAARKAVLGFRDSLAVKDPNLAENVGEGIGQLVPSFLMFSRVLGSLGNMATLTSGGEAAASSFAGRAAKFVAADTATNATAIAPHDPRLADVFSLLQHSEGKLADLMNTVAPDGSLVNKYIGYLADHTNETEAEGRWKNVLDGYNAAAALTGVLHISSSVLKQGWNALHYMADNNMGSMSDLMPANQEGKIGYHGTAATIDPAVGFDDTKIGTGEGNQSFGYGHYIAENPSTAGTYQARLATSSLAGVADARNAVKMAGGDSVKAYKQMIDMAADEQDAGLRMRMQKAAAVIKNGNIGAGTGNKYTVHVPDEKVEAMLDHDKDMAEQPELLNKIPQKDQQQLQKVLDDHGQDLELADLRGGQFRQVVERAFNEGYLDYGDSMDGNAARQASQYLASKGIPGIKYLDQGSRAAAEGTHNFVVFNGKDISITHKNGEIVGNQKMTLSSEQRALERERVAAMRDREEGAKGVFTPEPIPANAAEREGAAARRRKGD